MHVIYQQRRFPFKFFFLQHSTGTAWPTLNLKPISKISFPLISFIPSQSLNPLVICTMRWKPRPRLSATRAGKCSDSDPKPRLLRVLQTLCHDGGIELVYIKMRNEKCPAVESYLVAFLYWFILIISVNLSTCRFTAGIQTHITVKSPPGVLDQQ
jgi:hypothetical protein